MTGGLSEDDVAGLAAYCASLLPAEARAEGDSPELTPTLVRAGDAMRNIAPCASCHGGIGRKLGAPWLEGMPKAYLVAQLTAFGTGTRHKDSHAQMRNMARQLSSADIEERAGYYGRRQNPAGGRIEERSRWIRALQRTARRVSSVENHPALGGCAARTCTSWRNCSSLTR